MEAYKKWKGKTFDVEAFMAKFPDDDGDGMINFHEYVKRYEGDSVEDPDKAYKESYELALKEFSTIREPGLRWKYKKKYEQF